MSIIKQRLNLNFYRSSVSMSKVFWDMFWTGNPADGVTVMQYAKRLSHDYDRWIELPKYGALGQLLIK